MTGHLQRRKSMDNPPIEELMAARDEVNREIEEHEFKRKSPPKIFSAPTTPGKHDHGNPLAGRTVPSKLQMEAMSPEIMAKIRLARRKTLQYAPKIGSPLARSWKA